LKSGSCQIGVRIFGADLTLSFRNNRSTIWRRIIKIKCIFGPDFVPIYEGFFYYKYKLCIRVNLEIEGAEIRVYKGNNKTRVCIEFVSWQQALGFEGWFTVGNTIRIESLGYRKRLGLWVELGGRLILVTHWYLFCKVTHHYSETESCSLPQTRSIWIELGKQILLCSLFLSLAVFYFCLWL